MGVKTGTQLPPSANDARIVIGAQINDHAAHLAGVPSKRFFTDASTFTQVQRLVTEYYQLDALSNFWDVYNIEAEALGQKVIYHPDGIPDADRTHPLISTPSDLDHLSPPDPYTSGRMPWILEINRRFLDMTGKLDRAYFTAPFSLAVNIRGYENLVTDMFGNTRFVHRLFAFLCDDVLSPFIEAMRKDIGMPDLFMDGRDAWASPPMITLDMMDEFVVPYTKRLRDNVGAKLITRGNWGDAKSRDPLRFFSQKLQCSPGFLSVLDPDLHDVGPEQVKAFADEHDAFITAGVDAALLKEGPVDAIVARIKHYIDTLARDGRCMIHLNQIPAETPPEHVHAAVAACQAYGRLPLPQNLDDVHFDIPQRESFMAFLHKKDSPLAV